MPDFPLALISLGKWIGLMNQLGVIQWAWLGEPKTNTFKSLLDNRDQLGSFLQALLGDSPVSPYFDPKTKKLRWKALELGPAQIGLIWNETTTEPLQISFGGLVNLPIASEPFDLMARMLKFTAAEEVASEFGKFVFSAGLPVPSFLQSASLGGEYDSNLSLNLTVSDSQGSRELKIPSNPLPWNIARIGAFVLHAWLKKKAEDSPLGPPKNFFRRVDEHLFPMLGDPESVIKAFPLFANSMGAPDFKPWLDSIVPSDPANTSGTLTFLWHLRALITGNTSPNVVGGSTWFPLIGGQEGLPTPGAGEFALSDPPDPSAPSAWLGVITPQAGPIQLVVELRNGQPAPQGVKTIILFQRNGNSLEQPPLSAGFVQAFGTFVQNIPSLDIGAGQITFDAGSGTLKLVTADDLGGLTTNGSNSIELMLHDGESVRYRLKTPHVGLELPSTTDTSRQLFEQLVNWLVDYVTPDETFEPLAKSLAQLAIKRVNTGSVAAADVNSLLGVAAEAISDGNTIDLGPISIELTGGVASVSIESGPILPDQMTAAKAAFSIGKLKLTATLDLSAGQPFQEFKIQILDLRLGASDETTGAGLVGSLIPDMRNMPGFALTVGYDGKALDPFLIEGGGKIPIQQTIGPLEVVALLVDVRKNSVTVGVDLSFQLSIIKVSAYELGVRYKFDGSAPEVFLHGLGLRFDGGAIKLAGMFAEVTKGAQPSDYVGGAVVSIASMFQLSAIGAYTQTEGDASLFIFAALIAPLGGPPWFFVTGIAGGFGYNRTQPPSGRLTEHPFIKVMRGEIPIGTTDAGSLAAISAMFAAKKGVHWIAAGIQFTAFGFINGKVIVTVQFGNEFSFHLLGLAAFGISPIAYFELGIEVTADAKKFLLIAGLSSNSYIIHPDIFSLRGDFGLGIWYGVPDPLAAPAEPPAGDFILSIGGYHPAYRKPAHYPDLSRVGVKCTVYGFVRLSVEAFFACTPQALMAGVSISLSAEFMGIGAGLDVYVDVLITWDPFHLVASMGVTVWFEFFGRHEVGVALRIWTPAFGGTATIDLAIVSFDVDFGAAEAPPPIPLLHQFMTRQLGAPSEQGTWDEKTKHFGAIVKAFNTGEHEAGLFKIDITWGRTTKKQSTSAEQEGLDNKKPIHVNAEFGFALRTRMPLKESDVADPDELITLPLHGEVDLPLCKMEGMQSELTLAIASPNLKKADIAMGRLGDYYPLANFGDRLDAAQADDLVARMKVALVESEKPTIALTDGIGVTCEAKPSGLLPPDLVGLGEEDSTEPEEYPLPLGHELPLPVYRGTKSAAYFTNQLPAVAIKPKVKTIGRQQAALSEISKRTSEPLHVFEYTGDVQRLQVGAQIKGLAYTVVQPQQGRGRGSGAPVPQIPTISVPKSPTRRPELFGLNLRVAAPRSPIRLDRGRLENFTRAKNFGKRALTGKGGSRESFVATATVEAGKAVALELHGGRARETQLRLSGSQTVRVIFQGGAEDLIGDRYITGSATIKLPRRARRVTLIGEGMHPPVSETSSERGTFISAREALGVEHDTTLFALGRRAFAGHGCVFVANVALPFAPKPMDSVPGFKLLRAASNFTVHWPAVREGCLVLTIEPVGAGAPSSALNDVRWLSAGAELSGLSAIVAPSATALVMDFTAASAWSLDVDLGVKWRLTGVVAVQKSARDISNWLRSRTVWDLVDDRLQLGAEQAATDAVLEVNQ